MTKFRRANSAKDIFEAMRSASVATFSLTKSFGDARLQDAAGSELILMILALGEIAPDPWLPDQRPALLGEAAHADSLLGIESGLKRLASLGYGVYCATHTLSAKYPTVDHEHERIYITFDQEAQEIEGVEVILLHLLRPEVAKETTPDWPLRVIESADGDSQPRPHR